MIKYLNWQTTFSEIPDEITLCINLTNCPFRCNGCHSPQLREDIGEELTEEFLLNLVDDHPEVTCVCFMGGDNDTVTLNKLANLLHEETCIKVAWYSGRGNFIYPTTSSGSDNGGNEDYPDGIVLSNFTYIKVGGFLKEKGGLGTEGTNQRLYYIVPHYDSLSPLVGNLAIDITNKFLKDDNS